jgi:ketosteroid isomerase-like protein
MTASRNKAIVQRAFDGLAQADPAEFLAAMSDDLVWIITGSSQWSGRFDGKEAVQRDLIAPLFRLFATPYHNHAERIIADDEGNVVVLAKGEVRTRSGQDYNNDYCFVMRLHEGRIVEIREYMDSALAERVLGPGSPAMPPDP